MQNLPYNRCTDCTHTGYLLMDKTRVFKNGNSLAVRLPKGYRFASEEVWIQKNEDGSITIRERPSVPEGYRNTLSYLLDTAPSAPLGDTSEFFKREQDAFKEIF